ncbi:unnamed protein product, partial [Hymenolepis diminuta]
MDGIFEQTSINRLRSLNHTQKSIEKASQFFIKNRHLAPELVKLWYKEFHTAPAEQKLAFLHLVNDVLVNTMEKAPQFVQLFEPVLPLAFGETAKVQSHQIRSGVAHLLVVWADRRIYPRNFLRRLRVECQRSASQADNENPTKASGEPSPFDFSFTAALLSTAAAKSSKLQYQQRTPSLISPSTESVVVAATPTKFSPRESSLSPGARLREEMQHHDILLSAPVKPPETIELVKKLDALQNSAPSANVVTRQRISEFPVEVSNPEEAAKLIAQGIDRGTLIQSIQTALSQLEVYNAGLDEEMSQRQNLSLSLRAYKQALRESCQNIQCSIQNIREKRALISSLQNRLDNHVRNLPDDQKLEDEFLAPLPSVGDLF